MSRFVGSNKHIPTAWDLVQSDKPKDNQVVDSDVIEINEPITTEASDHVIECNIQGPKGLQLNPFGPIGPPGLGGLFGPIHFEHPGLKHQGDIEEQMELEAHASKCLNNLNTYHHQPAHKVHSNINIGGFSRYIDAMIDTPECVVYVSVDSFTYTSKPIVQCDLEARGRVFLKYDDALGIASMYRNLLVAKRDQMGRGYDISSEIVNVNPSEVEKNWGYTILLRIDNVNHTHAQPQTPKPRWTFKSYLVAGMSVVTFASVIAMMVTGARNRSTKCYHHFVQKPTIY